MKNLFAKFTLFLFCMTAFAKIPSWDYMWSLSFKKGEENIYTMADNWFYVDIEDVIPSSVQVAVNTLPSNVSYVSSKKESIVNGTRLIIVLRFSSTGYFRIKPIDVTVNSRPYRIPFSTVEVKENPRFTNPALSVRFESNKSTYEPGENILFTVYAKNVSVINDVYWTVSPNSILREVKRYDSVYNGQFPVIQFNLQVVKEGMFILPDIAMNVKGINGKTEEVIVPLTKINVRNSAVKTDENISEKKSFLYNQAFDDPLEIIEDNTRFNLDNEQIVHLLSLYHKERHSFILFSDSRKNRIAAERELGISSQISIPSIAVFHLILIMTAVFFVLMIIFLLIKKKSVTSVLSIFFVISFVCGWIQYSRITTRYGVFMGGRMHSIPEASNSTGVTVPSGSMVRITRSAGPWCYIKYNDTYGWVGEHEIALIK